MVDTWEDDIPYLFFIFNEDEKSTTVGCVALSKHTMTQSTPFSKYGELIVKCPEPQSHDSDRSFIACTDLQFANLLPLLPSKIRAHLDEKWK